MLKGDMAKLRAAFPGADRVSINVRDYGFKCGAYVRAGGRHYAAKALGGDIESAIDALRRWVPKKFQRRDDVEPAAGDRAF